MQTRPLLTLARSVDCRARLDTGKAHVSHPVCMQTGSLLTVAGLGDSRACLDTGKAVAQLTVDHRVATHKGERRRLQASHVHIAPIGLSGKLGSGSVSSCCVRSHLLWMQLPAARITHMTFTVTTWPGGTGACCFFKPVASQCLTMLLKLQS